MWRESYVTLSHYGWLGVVEALYHHDALTASRNIDYAGNILRSQNGATLYKSGLCRSTFCIKLYFATTNCQTPSLSTMYHGAKVADWLRRLLPTRYAVRHNIPTNMFHGGHVSMTP